MPTQREQLKYSVKITNPTKKSEYSMEKFTSTHFCKVEDLKEMHTLYSAKLPQSIDLQVGYIIPGHGLRGKQEWLCEDSDLIDMYTLYKGKKDLLWCLPRNTTHAKSRKRGKASSPTPSKAPRVSPYDSQRDKSTEVREILKELQDKHEAKYSAEQLHTWANLVQMKSIRPLMIRLTTHSLEAIKSVLNKNELRRRVHVMCMDRHPAGISPRKRLNMRSELIDQLGKCVNLLEKGALSQEEYQGLQSSIMSDIKTVSLPKEA